MNPTPLPFAARVHRKITNISGNVASVIWRLPPVTLKELVPDPTAVPPPILDDICLPPYYGPTDHDDYAPLMQIAASIQPKVIVELGTAHGNTVANLCRQCPGAKVYTVNALPETQTGELDSFRLDSETIGRVYRKYGFTSSVVQIFENTLQLDLSKHLPPSAIDLAIIDACHDTEYVINDFKKVKPFMRPHGIVLFHDTHPSMASHLRGSYLGCVKLRQQGYKIRQLVNTWWGVLINE